MEEKAADWLPAGRWVTPTSPPPLPGWQSPGSIPSPGSGSAAPRNAPDAVRQVRAGAVDVHRLQRCEHLQWGAGGRGMRGDTCDDGKERAHTINERRKGDIFLRWLLADNEILNTNGPDYLYLGELVAVEKLQRSFMLGHM